MVPASPHDHTPQAGSRADRNSIASVTSPRTSGLVDGSPALIPDRKLPAWALSVLLHGALFLVLLLLMAQFRNGAGEVENRSGGIVLVDVQSETTEYLSEGEVEFSAAPSEAGAEASAAPEMELAPELPGLSSSANPSDGVADSVLDNLPGADSMIAVAGQPGEIGGKTTTAVFGVAGTGSRFVYVFDRSESMALLNNRPLLAARQELVKSIESLPSTSQFQIIFYNKQPRLFNPDGNASIYFAEDKRKEQAKRFIRSIAPDGGTDHLTALKAAFRLSPDVIFLLTDAEGGFTADELRQLSRANQSAAVINAIEFGQRRGTDRSLERVATTSGGQYVFKNIMTLKVEQ